MSLGLEDLSLAGYTLVGVVLERVDHRSHQRRQLRRSITLAARRVHDHRQVRVNRSTLVEMSNDDVRSVHRHAGTGSRHSRGSVT